MSRRSLPAFNVTRNAAKLARSKKAANPPSNLSTQARPQQHRPQLSKSRLARPGNAPIVDRLDISRPTKSTAPTANNFSTPLNFFLRLSGSAQARVLTPLIYYQHTSRPQILECSCNLSCWMSPYYALASNSGLFLMSERLYFLVGYP